MNDAMPFDTFKMVERLENAGVPTAHANVQAALIAEVMRAEDLSIIERFSSKQEVSQEFAAIKFAIDQLESKIDNLDSRLTSKFDQRAAEIKSEFIRWVVSVGILQMVLIAGLLLKLVH